MNEIEEKLIELMKSQEKHLKQLLELLMIQKELIIKKDVFLLEEVVTKLNECSKRIAKEEVARRNMINNGSIKEVINNAKNKELTEAYNNISNILKRVVVQKGTNELLLKQELNFTIKILNAMEPKQGIVVYNSNGNIKR